MLRRCKDKLSSAGLQIYSFHFFSGQQFCFALVLLTSGQPHIRHLCPNTHNRPGAHRSDRHCHDPLRSVLFRGCE